MKPRTTPSGGTGRHSWLSRIALTAAIPLAITMPAAAQEEIDPMEAMRLQFDACIASGTDGAECAATAKLMLEAIISGDPVSVGDASTDQPVSDGVPDSQVDSSSGQDGQMSSGGDQALSDDGSGDAAAEDEAVLESTPIPPADGTDPPPTDGTESPPTEGTELPPVEDSTAPPPAETEQLPGSSTTTTTTTETGTTTGSTSTLSGGAQTQDASGASGERRGQD